MWDIPLFEMESQSYLCTKNRLHVATVMCATTSVSRQDCNWDEAEVFGKEFSIKSRNSVLEMSDCLAGKRLIAPAADWCDGSRVK